MEVSPRRENGCSGKKDPTSVLSPAGYTSIWGPVCSRYLSVWSENPRIGVAYEGML